MNIIEPELVAPAELEPHPRNYRTHPREQIRQIIASIESAGFYRNVVATRRGNVILAGHGVVQAAREMGLERVPVAFVDVDPDSPAALRVLSGDNLLPGMAQDDEEALLEILREIASDEDLEQPLAGSGFTEDDLERIKAAAEVDEPATDGLEIDTEGQEEQNADTAEVAPSEDPTHRVVASCRNAEEAEAVVKAVEGLGLVARVIEL